MSFPKSEGNSLKRSNANVVATVLPDGRSSDIWNLYEDEVLVGVLHWSWSDGRWRLHIWKRELKGSE